MLKAILFDLDDTLLDWSGFSGEWPSLESVYLQRVYDLALQQGAVLEPFQRFYEAFRENTADGWREGRIHLGAPNLGTILVTSIEAVGAPAGLLSERDCLEAYQWRAVPGTRLFPEVREQLALLREHGLKMAIVTNAFQPMWIRDVEIEEHGLLEFFPDCRISAADVGYLKPHPAIFQAALDQLGVKPSEAVFVGDNPAADIAGAKGVGMQAVFRVTHSVILSEMIQPDAAIHSLEELPAVLDRLQPGWRG